MLASRSESAESRPAPISSRRVASPAADARRQRHGHVAEGSAPAADERLDGDLDPRLGAFLTVARLFEGDDRAATQIVRRHREDDWKRRDALDRGGRLDASPDRTRRERACALQLHIDLPLDARALHDRPELRHALRADVLEVGSTQGKGARLDFEVLDVARRGHVRVVLHAPRHVDRPTRARGLAVDVDGQAVASAAPLARLAVGEQLDRPVRLREG